VTLGPGGYHLMLIGLVRPLKTGDRIPATLAFANGARVKVEFAVGTGAPPAAHQHP
jgi:copper(I)-binding protein